jgi:coenzyme F420-reducing hydrogenase beta subunit
MVDDNEGFSYPEVNETECTKCGLCESVCPETAPAPPKKDPIAFASWHRDASIRSNSSSGGVFYALMDGTFQEKGVVFGAAFNSSLTLCHDESEELSDAEKFMGSKYIQSRIGLSYQSAATHLKKGRKVLFSGTPCQIAGLYGYLGGDNDNLVTCDLICHGVPSPKVFALYRKTMEKKKHGNIVSIRFRDKKYGWKNYSTYFQFDNGKKYHRTKSEDPFVRGFLQNLYLRPSCHTCRFNKLPRIGDISLGDFWGIGRHHQSWDNDRGTSLVLVQTEKGHAFFERCRKSLTANPVDINAAINSNSCISSPVPPSKYRDSFFNALASAPFHKVMRTYMAPPSLAQRAVKKILRLKT